MEKKIKNMTRVYGNYSSIVGKKMMARYANEDWDYDVVDYIDKTINNLKSDDEISKEEAVHILNYWKYVFLKAKGEEREAQYHLKKAYLFESPDAIAQYAYFYYTGKGNKSINRKKAIKLFDKALSQTSMFAEYFYAEALTHSYGTDLEVLQEAIPYYETALKKGVLFARYNLALCYYKTGTKYDEAIKLLGKCNSQKAELLIERIKEKRKATSKK